LISFAAYLFDISFDIYNYYNYLTAMFYLSIFYLFNSAYHLRNLLNYQNSEIRLHF